MKADIKEKLELPEGVTAELKESTLLVKGPKGEVSRILRYPRIIIKVDGSAISISSDKATKREKKMVYTFLAHIKNMIKGVQEPFIYKLKICSGHFPMNVSIKGDELVVKNFLGEKNPRMTRLAAGAEVKMDGDAITIESANKEVAGRVASDIELLTKTRGRDLRIFQDGIYIVEKAGVKVAK